MKKKYKVTRTWFIESEQSTDVLYKADERVCDKVEVECLENQFAGGGGFRGADLESTRQSLGSLLERAREQRAKKYPYIVHESIYNESLIRHFYRESDLINDFISILKEIK